MRTIALEEHYATPAFMDGPGHQIKQEAAAAHAHPQVAGSPTWTPPVSTSRSCR
jgi:uncharacterized protein